MPNSNITNILGTLAELWYTVVYCPLLVATPIHTAKAAEAQAGTSNTTSNDPRQPFIPNANVNNPPATTTERQRNKQWLDTLTQHSSGPITKKSLFESYLAALHPPGCICSSACVDALETAKITPEQRQQQESRRLQDIHGNPMVEQIYQALETAHATIQALKTVAQEFQGPSPALHNNTSTLAFRLLTAAGALITDAFAELNGKIIWKQRKAVKSEEGFELASPLPGREDEVVGLDDILADALAATCKAAHLVRGLLLYGKQLNNSKVKEDLQELLATEGAVDVAVGAALRAAT
ncbi:hypothetical protein B0T19DRAFT_469156 [Cercophora scortea]|uniref:Uncharacterized protein n=1 Tax=Cercophora scortea TaxID=314031 RepID=A0AAE0I3A1_9PEZI|nr:hypothetical protein B0T19DRAFT_469156 [Cercophora scortea]